MKKKLLGYYNYTVVLTYCGMLIAFFGIMRIMSQDYWTAAFCLLLAGVCDMFDGAVAAIKTRTEKEKRFGIQIDSLSDLICFGVLPGIFVYRISGKNMAAGIIASFFILCALIRLAYFNVMEEERQSQTQECRKSYSGVPVTAIAVLLPAVYMLYNYKLCKNTVYFSILLILTGIGFLLPVRIKKPGTKGKIVLLLLGISEAAGLMAYMGWGGV